MLYGDTPFIRAETLQAMIEAPADVVVLGFEAADPGRYGRLVTGPEGLRRIVEFKDASPEERAITFAILALSAPMRGFWRHSSRG